jgi:site-specific DNA recombinase
LQHPVVGVKNGQLIGATKGAFRNWWNWQSAKTDAVDRRRVSLQCEVSDTEECLRRLYRSIEDGIVEPDDILRERTASLKSEREQVKAVYDPARAQCGTVAMIDSIKIDAFARLMTDKLDNGETNARKATSA